jgi:hypothetical protein
MIQLSTPFDKSQLQNTIHNAIMVAVSTHDVQGGGNGNVDQCPKCYCQLDKVNLTEGWLHCYCKRCHFSHEIPITHDNPIPHNIPLPHDNPTPHNTPIPKDNAITYIIIYLVCVGVSFILWSFPFFALNNNISYTFSVIFPIAALVAIVTGFIRHPKSRAIKVLFWITIALIAFAVISIVVAIITCIHTCATCDPIAFCTPASVGGYCPGG